MTQNEVLRISEPVEKLYMDCASQLLINLCGHFKTDKALASREWEIKKLSELGALTEESIEIIAANTGVAPEQIKNAVSEALKTELSGVENTLASAAKKGLIAGPTASFEASENVRIVLNNLVEQAVKDSNVVNTVMLESVRNQYLFAINNTLTEEQAEIERMQSAANLQQLDEQLAATQQALNASTFSVASGSEARTTALRRTIKQLADQGITGYIDAGGHKWSPEAYINMDIRTTVHNAAVQGQKARSADYQVTTFLVSSHSGARPLCYPYQGKVFSWDGSEGAVYDLDGNPYHYESIYNTSYGQAAGLFGINCGHSPLTFVDGYTVPRLSPPEDEEENARIYKESQQQRAIEREIRGAKTEALAYQAAGDTEGFEKAAKRVKKYNAEYKDFCERTGRTERTNRTQVYGYNRSTAAKARAAAKDYTPTLKGPADVKTTITHIPNKVQFTPAATLDEATAYAERFVDGYKSKYTGNLNYKGVYLEYANDMNKAMTEVFEAYAPPKLRNIVPFNRRMDKFKDTNAEAAYQWLLGDMFYNKDIYKTAKAFNEHYKQWASLTETVLNNIDVALEKTKAAVASASRDAKLRYIEALKATGRSNVSPPSAYGSTIHELGHFLDDKLFGEEVKKRGIDLKDSFAKYSGGISAYATSNTKEYVAESFTSYWMGEYNRIDPKLLAIFEDLQQ